MYALNQRNAIFVSVLVIALLIWGSCAPAISPAPSTTATPAPSIPPEVAQNTGGWPLANYDYSNTRCTTESMINSTNVKDLGVDWAFPISGAAKGNPVIAGGVVYYQDFNRDVIAIDVYGNLKWQKRYDNPSPDPKGVSLGWGKVFVPSDVNSVAALDINTGQELWVKRIFGNATELVNIQPVAFKGMVFVSTTTAGLTEHTIGGNVGTIFALDEKTGNTEWSFDTADSKDVWGNPGINGGGGCYFPAAIDTDTSTMYWATAGPAPFPGTAEFPNGSSRLGPNLYTDSVLALDAVQGKLKWFYQVYPHDLFGYSMSMPPILAAATVGGIQQDIVIASGEMGNVYAFNRKTGKLLWDTAVGRHENDKLTELPSGVTRVYPAAQGGIGTPMAFSEGILYAAVNDMYADFTPSTYSPQSVLNASSEIVAINVETGKPIWETNFDSASASPVTVVNDLVFVGTLDGKVRALSRITGEEVWEYSASPDTATGWLAVSGDTIVLVANVEGIPSLVALRLAAHEPKVIVVSPINDSWIPPEADLTITVEVSNFKLTDAIGAANIPGEGHLIYYNNVDAPTTPGAPAFSAPGTFAMSADTIYTWRNLAMNEEGGYGFWVQLVNNDNTPLVPPVLAAVVVNMIGFHPD
jgi:outer membrane protein assembly factor BamB